MDVRPSAAGLIKAFQGNRAFAKRRIWAAAAPEGSSLFIPAGGATLCIRNDVRPSFHETTWLQTQEDQQLMLMLTLVGGELVLENNTVKDCPLWLEMT